MKMFSKETLIAEAKAAREKARADFSNFKVGAALRTPEGKIYHGSNIESSSYGLTICAERVAIFKAVSEGETEFTDIAIVADTDGAVAPCGACRQIMIDYALNATVHLANIEGVEATTTVKDLMPGYFSREDLVKTMNEK